MFIFWKMILCLCCYFFRWNLGDFLLCHQFSFSSDNNAHFDVAAGKLFSAISPWSTVNRIFSNWSSKSIANCSRNSSSSKFSSLSYYSPVVRLLSSKVDGLGLFTLSLLTFGREKNDQTVPNLTSSVRSKR
jgi:hypothetical protein